jgi:hypothetical protein
VSSSRSESQEQPVSARIQPSGLLLREPVREAEVIEEEQPEPAPQEPHREPEWVTNWKRAADTKTSQDHGEEVSDDGLSPPQPCDRLAATPTTHGALDILGHRTGQ